MGDVCQKLPDDGSGGAATVAKSTVGAFLDSGAGVLLLECSIGLVCSTEWCNTIILSLVGISCALE